MHFANSQGALSSVNSKQGLQFSAFSIPVTRRSKQIYPRLLKQIQMTIYKISATNCFATNPTNRFATNPTNPTDRFATNPTNPTDRLQGTNSGLDAQILFAFMTLNRFLELISSAEQSICILCEKYFRSVF